MGNLPPSDSPHPLDWVEFWRIGWQENAHYPMVVFDEKIFEIYCSMPPGIVHNHEYRSFGLL
jgi:hypothetical protein